MATREEVFAAISEERAYQERKYGKDKQQSLAGFLLVLERELNEAKEGWIKNSTGRSAPLHEILQVAAVCVGCLEKYGMVGTAVVTDDVSYEEYYKQNGEPEPLDNETEQKVRHAPVWKKGPEDERNEQYWRRADPYNDHNHEGIPK